MAVGTTRGKRKLGAFMQGLLKQYDVKVDTIIKEVRCSRSTINRMLAGEARPRWATFVAVLGVFRLSDEDRSRAVDLWEVADVEAMPIEHAALLSDKYLRFRRDESEAVAERAIDMLLIPGMFQTPAYAEAIAVGNRLLLPGKNWNERAAPERRDRQSLLRRGPKPLEVHALIDEAALRRHIGGLEVMREQWQHLIDVASWPNVTIQIIPSGVGAHGAMSGTLTILDFPEADDPGSAYVEHLVGLEPVEDEDGIARLRAVWDDVAARALSVDASVDLIRSVKDETG